MTLARPNLFYALWPDDATRAALARWQTHLHGRPIRTYNLHLTLAFLGPQQETVLPALSSLLALLDSPPIELTIDRLGYFRKIRIAWAGTHAVPPVLSALRESLVQELTDATIPFDNKEFRPHITLARDAPLPTDLPLEPFLWRADHLALARSPLPGEKPAYQLLASRRLGSATHTPEA